MSVSKVEWYKFIREVSSKLDTTEVEWMMTSEGSSVIGPGDTLVISKKELFDMVGRLVGRDYSDHKNEFVVFVPGTNKQLIYKKNEYYNTEDGVVVSTLLDTPLVVVPLNEWDDSCIFTDLVSGTSGSEFYQYFGEDLEGSHLDVMFIEELIDDEG